MPAGRGSNSLKDPELYEELREDGASKEKAARISNAAARDGRSAVGHRGGAAGRLRRLDGRAAAQARQGAGPHRLLAQEEVRAHRHAARALSWPDSSACGRERTPASGASAPAPASATSRADGSTASDEDRERIHTLVIPPAWTDVWISAEPYGHIQAVGTDDAGRRQYLYHPRWRERRDKGKFARALRLAEALPGARRRVTTSLRTEGLESRAGAGRVVPPARPGRTAHRIRALSRAARQSRAHDTASTGCLGRGIRRHALVPRQERPARLHRGRRRRARGRRLGARRGTTARAPPGLPEGQAARGAQARGGQRLHPRDRRGPLHGEGLPHAPRHDPRRRGARAHGHRRHRAPAQARRGARGAGDGRGAGQHAGRGAIELHRPAGVRAVRPGASARPRRSRPSPRSGELLGADSAYCRSRRAHRPGAAGRSYSVRMVRRRAFTPAALVAVVLGGAIGVALRAALQLPARERRQRPRPPGRDARDQRHGVVPARGARRVGGRAAHASSAPSSAPASSAASRPTAPSRCSWSSSAERPRS